MSDISRLPVSSLRPVSENALREARRNQQDYEEMKDSVEREGILKSLLVRPRTDADTGEEYYEVVDGTQRFGIAIDLGLDEVPVQIRDIPDEKIDEIQVMANVHQVATKKAEFAGALKRIMAGNVLITEAELAKRLGKSVTWVQSILDLNNLANDDIKALVNNGSIKLANAVPLSKLPPEEQADWVEDAIAQTHEQFVPRVTERIKEIRDQARKGRDAAPAEFKPVPHMKKLKELRDELDTKANCNKLAEMNPDLPLAEAIALGIAFSMSMDPLSQEAQRAAWEKRQEEKNRKAAERAAKKAEKSIEQAQDGLESAKRQKANAEAIAAGKNPPFPEEVSKTKTKTQD